jgi:IS5 family transposase
MEAVEQPFFNKLWDLTVRICHDAQVPLYVEKHDPKVFTTVQKVYLWLYKVKKKLTLRGLIDDLSTSTLVEYLRLPRVPDFSMLSHFLKSIPMRLLRAIDDALQQILPDFKAIIIDSTGFECTHPSHYYCQRCNSPYPVDGFITLYTAIDQEHGFIRAHATRARKVHDSKMLKPLVKKIKKKLNILYADRGHDSEENYRFLIEERDCTPLILQKYILKPLHKCKGEYRREMREIFEYGEYLKRNKIEGVYAGIKRPYGCTLTTRTLRNQHKELLLKVIIYNLERKIRMIILIIILRRNTFQQNQKILLLQERRSKAA